MRKLTIRSFMTPSPLTIRVDEPLAAAWTLMREHRVRHLPVVDAAGTLVGIVSERDLALAGGLPGIDPERVAVAEAMTPSPLTLGPDTSLEWVAVEMVERRYGSVIVVEDGRVVGIFTTIDALRALQELLARARRRRPVRLTPRP